MTPNECKKIDRIKQLKFEIEQFKRRKMNCGSDTNCSEKIDQMITAHELEISQLDPPYHVKSEEDKIDSDNNEYRDRHNRFIYDKDVVE